MCSLVRIGILNRVGEAKTKTEEVQAEEELKLAITNLVSEYYIEGGAEDFRDYMFKQETKLKAELGNADITLNKEAKTIIYKGKMYGVDENGKLTKLDGIFLSESTKTLDIIEGELNEQATLTATLASISGDITWTANPTGIVELIGVGNTATIKALTAGTTTITASCAGKTATCEVTVKNVTKATSLSLDKTTANVDECEEITITAIQEGSGTEEIEWTTSDASKATVEGTGENGAIGKIRGKNAGTVTITAKTKYTNKTASCTVTVNLTYIDNSYVEYDVEYTDVYDENKKFTKKTGWRLLTEIPEADETRGEYRGNIEIISTGIPVGLYYNYEYIKKEGYNEWAGDETQRHQYAALDYYHSSGNNEDNNNIHAASGLRYNFKKIKFKKQSGDTIKSNNEYNMGYYTEIKRNGETLKDETSGEEITEINGEIFKVNSKVSEVRSVTWGDIIGDNHSSSIKTIATTETEGKVTDKRAGLFKLNDYTPKPYGTGWYWLASPYPSTAYNLSSVYYNGNIYGSHNNHGGVRPVVSMNNVHLKRKAGNAHVWEIVE